MIFLLSWSPLYHLFEPCDYIVRYIACIFAGDFVRFGLEKGPVIFERGTFPTEVGVGTFMENTKSFKKAILITMVSAVTSLVVTAIGKKLLSVVSERRQLAAKDTKLNMALEDSMDCSDAVAKY